MNEPQFDQKLAHRWFAIELNNAAWDLLEEEDLSPAQAEMLIHAAHAACYHWLQIGNVANHARAECLVANAYAAIGHGEQALRHATRCEQLVTTHPGETEDWDSAFAHDCLARAYAAAGMLEEAIKRKQQARALGDRIANSGDKKVFDQWFFRGNWHGAG